MFYDCPEQPRLALAQVVVSRIAQDPDLVVVYKILGDMGFKFYLLYHRGSHHKKREERRKKKKKKKSDDTCR